jgi:hypothetical protein
MDDKLQFMDDFFSYDGTMTPLPFNRRPFYEQLGMSSQMRKIMVDQACRLG